MAISLTKGMRDAITRSGYLLESQVAEIVRERYYVIPNYSFRDPETGQNREIDVHAITVEPIRKRGLDFIFPILLIECKNIQAPLVFFSHESIPSRHVVGDLQISGIPKEIKTKEGLKKDLTEYLGLEEIHHYYKTANISTQFCAIVKESSDYIATHKIKGPLGNLYESMILPLIKAVHYEIQEHEDSYRPDPEKETINLQFYYPIVVIDGSLFECSLTKGGKHTYRKRSKIDFLRRYESLEISGEYRIDIVTAEGLTNLLSEINMEMELTAKRIKQKRAELIENARRIATQRLEEEKPRLI